MGWRIAVAAIVAMALGSAGAIAGCPVEAHPKHHSAKHRPQSNDCVFLGNVPQISNGIVAAEPMAPRAKPSSPPDFGTPAYTGPTVGMATPGVKPAPTVGYKWSLQ